MDFISEYQDLTIADPHGLVPAGAASASATGAKMGGGGGGNGEVSSQEQLPLPSKNLFFDGKELKVWGGR